MTDDSVFNQIIANFAHSEDFTEADEVYVEPVPEADLKEWDCW